MKNPDEDYNRLHDHMTAIARERDHAVRTIDTLTKQLEELKDALTLAHEALRKEMPDLKKQNDHFFNQGHLWGAMMHELAEHLGNALYSDEWRTREYAIALFSQYEKHNPDHARDVDEMVNK
jgi:FtsZ-binding cell division protein ZapB